MVTQSPQIVGIVGGSCAGKTWLASRLEMLLEGRAVRLSQDDFYRDRSYLSPGRRPLVNFDHPRAIDWQRLEAVLAQFRLGRSASVPRYDFTTHGRMPIETTVRPTEIILVEGLWLFRRPSVRKLLDWKIYISAPVEWRESRRLERDLSERGRTAEQVRQQLAQFTFPMHDKFVEPQERWANEVVQAPVTENEAQRLASMICPNLQAIGI